MDNIAETIEYRGRTINILYDEFAESPEMWRNDDCFLVHDHRQFSVERKGFDPKDIFEHTKETGKDSYEGYHVFPLYAYIHSGVSLSLGRSGYPFTCSWDTSFAGFVLVKKSAGWSWRRDKAHKIAESVVKEWNDYLSGQVYGFDIDGDSCYGFYGDEGKKDAIQEAKASIDSQIAKSQKSHFEQLKIWIKNRVPISKRNSLRFVS